jgi:HK97 family phage prohead protease
MKLERAYTVLEVKSTDDEQRIIEGIASTPTPDRYQDIVEPLGAKYALPMPLLWQHKSDAPVGNVEFAKPTKEGIPFKARILSLNEEGALKARLDEAWQSVKLGLIRAVSIGFRPIEMSFLDDGGVRYLSWEWLELSLVTIPANGEATINVVRSLDAIERAALGDDPVALTHPAAHIVRLNEDPSRAREPFVIQTIHRGTK